MASLDRDEFPMLPDNHPNSLYDPVDSQPQRLPSWIRSASFSVTTNSIENYGGANLVGHTGPLRNERTPFIQMSTPLHASSTPENPFPARKGGLIGQKTTEPKLEKYPSLNKIEKNENAADDYASRNEHLLRSGQLGLCNDPYCTTCPSYFNIKAAENYSKPSSFFDPKFHNSLYGDAKGWARRFFYNLCSCVPGIMNPHAKFVQRWNKFFVISCLVAIFVDPLFFFLISVKKDHKCIVLNWTMATTIIAFRSLTDFVYLLHMLLQFRLAYVAPESRVVGAGELVDQPEKIAVNYLTGYFLLDFFIVLPLPQILILSVLPKYLGSSGANYAKNLLRAAVLVQYIPRLYKFLPLLAGQSPTGFIFESAWANFIINLLTFVLTSHVIGSSWYLFGLQRVNQCLRDACHSSRIESCTKFLDCGRGHESREFGSSLTWTNWTTNEQAVACFEGKSFNYGIYLQSVMLTAEESPIKRYIYSLFWGFQQISTLAGNQTPSYFVWEVLFTMLIIGLGLVLFALLVGNMQNFLQALGRRRLEMLLRSHDVEQWMNRRRLPEDLKRQVREAERYNWAATRGVNEVMLIENLPEDLQKDIRRHLFKFVQKVRILSLMDEPILDAICERLRHKTYIKGNHILYRGGLVEMLVFIVRGKMASTGEDGMFVPLSEGDVCGEELLTWSLEHSTVIKDGKKIKNLGQRLISSRVVKCLTNVETFVLRASDLEEVTSLFARFLRNPRVQGAIRYESPYWRSLAAAHIQVAWKYRQRRLKRPRRIAANS